MDFFSAIILGLMQGLFEWLPVSSQGQIIGTAVAFLKIDPVEAFKYSIMLHAGTLIAAAIYFRKQLKEFFLGQNKETRNFLLVALLATSVTAIPTFLFLKSILSNSFVILLLVSVMLFVTGFLQKIQKKTAQPNLSLKNSILLGLAQGFSVLPGISRSGITTAALLFRGFSPEKAFQLSFLLSIPSVLIAEIGFGVFEGFFFDLNSLIALVIAMVFGFVSIDLLLRFAKKFSFSNFCFVFGIIYFFIAFFAV